MLCDAFARGSSVANSSRRTLRRYFKETAASPDGIERMPFFDLIGCCTGTSAGLAFLRMRSMYPREGLGSSFLSSRRRPKPLPAIGTGVGGCQEIDRPGERRTAARLCLLLSMSTPLMALRKLLILRRPRRGRLEGRTTLIQAIVDFLTTSAGVTEWRRVRGRKDRQGLQMIPRCHSN